MPIFFALFSVLRYIAEWKGGSTLYHLAVPTIHSAQNAQIFGVSIKDTFLHATSVHVRVLVGLVVVTSMLTTYLTMRQSVKRGMMPSGKDSAMGQQQRLLTYVMPLFALTGLYWPFGLVLYWVTTNVWTLGQQFVLLRKYPVGAALAAGGGLPAKGSAGQSATASGFTGGASGKPKSAGPGGAAGTAKPKSAGPGGAAGTAKPKSAGTAGAAGTAKPKPKQADVTTSKPAVTDKAVGSGVQDARPDAGGTEDASRTADANGRVTTDREAKPAGTGKAATPGQSGSAATGSATGHKPAGAGECGGLRRIGRAVTQQAVGQALGDQITLRWNTRRLAVLLLQARY
jgi:YidC/Oxa1 family membrane protein insertase